VELLKRLKHHKRLIRLIRQEKVLKNKPISLDLSEDQWLKDQWLKQKLKKDNENRRRNVNKKKHISFVHKPTRFKIC
jgi:hypothetical protein